MRQKLNIDNLNLRGNSMTDYELYQTRFYDNKLNYQSESFRVGIRDKTTKKN